MKIINIILLVFLSMSLSATNIHVATSGDDSNGDGSINNPYATLEYGANLAQSGDTVFIHGGTYRNSDFDDGDIWTGKTFAKIRSHGEASAYIVIQPYENESVVFEFDGNYGILFSSASYIKFDGFEVKGVADMISQKEAEDAWGLYKDKDDVDYPNTVHNLLDSMPVTDGGTEIIDSITNPKIQGQKLSKKSMNNIVKPVHYNGRGIVANSSHHIIISNNIVRDVPSSAIRVQGSDFITVENNEVYHNTYWTTLGVGAITVAEATVLDGDTSNDIKIKLINNRVYQNENRMISWNPTKDIVNFIIDEGTGLFLTRNNNSYDNGKILIANNISYQNGASGIVCHYTDRVIIEQNTVYDNGTTNDGAPGGIGVNTSDDIVIRNNISYSKENKWALGVLAKPITNLVCEGNIVFNNSGTEDVINNTTIFSSGYTEVNPLFVDTVNFNLHLKEESPAIDAGSVNTLQTEDIDYVDRNDGSPDIGAYEFRGATLSEVRSKQDLLIGFNRRSDKGTWWTDDTFKERVAEINPDIIRYPGGTQANYWDWSTGKFIPNTDKNWNNKEEVTIPTFLDALPANCKVIYVVNIARPTPATGVDVNSDEATLKSDATLELKIDDMLEALAEFENNGTLPYAVEIGNEFYFGNEEGAIFEIIDNGDGTYSSGWDFSNDVPYVSSSKADATIYNAKLYLHQSKRVIERIKEKYPDIKFALVGSRITYINNSGEEKFSNNWLNWNNTIFDELKNNSEYATIKDDVFATTQHHYLSDKYGDNTVITDVSSSVKAIAEGVWYPSTKQSSLDTVPSQYQIWLTEYGVTKPNADTTWVDGIRSVALTFRWMKQSEQVKMLDYHYISAYNTIYGDVGEYKLAPLGIVAKMVMQATSSMEQMQEVVFTNNPEAISTTEIGSVKSLYGYKFKNSDKEVFLILNISDNDIAGIQIDNMITYHSTPVMSYNYSEKPWITNVYAGHSNIISENSISVGNTITFKKFSLTLIQVDAVKVNDITVQGKDGVDEITTDLGTLQMEATILPANAEDKSVTWSVVNVTGQATIDADGVLSAISDGEVTVVASANDGSGIIGQATIILSNQASSLPTNWYVDQQMGDDTNDGTLLGTAFQTFEKAMDVVEPGDTVFIVGEYHNQSYDATYSYGAPDDAILWNAENTLNIRKINGSQDKYITITSYVDENRPAVIKGNGVNIIKISLSSYIRLVNLNIQGEVGNIPLSTANALQFVYIDKDNLTGTVTNPTPSDIHYRNEEDDDGDHIVEETDSYPDISGLDIVRPSYIDTRGIYLTSTCEYVEIINNTVHHLPGGGVRIAESRYVNVIGNDIHNNSRRTYSGTHGLVVTKTNSCDNSGDTAIYIARNKVHHNYNEQYSWSPSKTIITPKIDEGKGISLQKNNTSNWNSGYGRIIVENNITYWNGFSGVHSNSGNRIDFKNNTVFMNSYTNTVTYANDEQRGSNIGISFSGGDDVSMSNNIVVVDTDWGGFALSASSVTNMTVINNIICGINNTSVDRDSDVTSVEVNTTEADTKFADAPTTWQDETYVFDFNILPTSPAIGYADENLSPIDDFNTIQRDVNPDNGALELVPVSSIVVQGQGGINVIDTDDGKLLIEVEYMPPNATFQDYRLTVENQTGSAYFGYGDTIIAVSNGNVKVKAISDIEGVEGEVVISINNQKVTFTSITDGNWDDDIWDQVAPAKGPDDVYVIIANTVTIDSDNIKLSKLKVKSDGILDLGNTTGHNFGTILGTGTIKIESPNLPEGDYSSFNSEVGGTYEFAGTSYSLPATLTEVDKIFISASGDITMPDTDITINGKLTISGPSTLKVICNDNRTINIRERLVLTGGRFESGTGSVFAFNGTENQVVRGNLTGVNALSSIKINNHAGVSVNGNIEIKEQLILTDGIVTVASGKSISILNTANDAVVGGSDTSHVYGVLKKVILANDNFTFEVGDSSLLYSIGIINCNYKTGESESKWRAQCLGVQDISDIKSGDELNSVITEVKWEMGCPVEAQGEVTLFMNSINSLNGIDNSYLRVAKLTAGEWHSVGNTNVTGDNISGVIISQDTVNFSYQTFTVGTSSTALPVELLFFKGSVVDGNIVLSWATASEMNNDFFEIYRSTDAVNYTVIAKVGGHGTTLSRTDYTYVDKDISAFVDTYYYKLKQVDYNGSVTNYNPISVTFNSKKLNALKEDDIYIYPNPYVSGGLTIKTGEYFIDKYIEIGITDIRSRTVLSKEIYNVNGIINLTLDNTMVFTKGVYILSISNNNIRKLSKLIVN